MIHIPTILFGQPERTLFRVNGVDAVWFQDVKAVDRTSVLRYTTIAGAGMMSVYVAANAADTSVICVADSDRTILCDEHGNPTSVTGIQRYFPPSVLAPAYLEVGERKFYRTEGQWAWLPSTPVRDDPPEWNMPPGYTVEYSSQLIENYPDAPFNENDRYRHDNSFYSDGEYLWWDEDFWYWIELIKNAPDGLGWAWKKEYSRGFLFDVADRTLMQFTDNLRGRVYERA